jgi:hypothetical protein
MKASFFVAVVVSGSFGSMSSLVGGRSICISWTDELSFSRNRMFDDFSESWSGESTWSESWEDYKI